ncbi:MAG: hypothetical protein FWH11_08045 [Micrococcales bacterium]|nr:hypothetical protein [Micrococcales bacterium]
MTDLAEEEPVLGDLPELPDHVWTAALGHAFDPQAEPDAALVPTDDLPGLDAGYDLALPGDQADDLTDDAALDTVHDLFDHAYDDHDTSGYDPGYPDHGYDNPGFADTDGYF